jgi:hypothetical protein
MFSAAKVVSAGSAVGRTITDSPPHTFFRGSATRPSSVTRPACDPRLQPAPRVLRQRLRQREVEAQAGDLRQRQLDVIRVGVRVVSDSGRRQWK